MKFLFFTAAIFLSACASNPLAEINSDVNGSVRYVADAPGKDHWQSAEETEHLGTGDCEDYAILKMAKLPAQYRGNLVAVKEYTSGQYHVILRATNRESHETFYLDNMRDDLVAAHMFGAHYGLIKILPEGAATRKDFTHGASAQ